MKFKYLITFVLLFVCIIGCGINAMAMETGFVTEEVSEEDKEQFKNKKTFTLVTLEPEKESIRCFAVSDDGLIALGIDKFSFTTEKAVYIYNSDGEFQYGYTFTTYGTFGVEFNGDCLDIYFVRSELIYTVDRSGEIVNIRRAPSSKENSNYYIYVVDSTTKKIGETTYTIRNDLGAFRNLFTTSYSQVVLTNGDVENIIYDVSELHRSRQTVNYIVLFVVFMAAGINIIVLWLKEIYKYHKNKKINRKNARWHFD